MPGVVEQTARRSLGVDPAAIEHHRPVRDLSDDREVVGDEDEGQVEFPLQSSQQGEDRCLHRHVGRRYGLIGDQDVRPDSERSRDCDPLSLTPGQLVGPELQDGVRKVDHREQFACSIDPIHARDDQFHRSVHRSGHDDRCQHKHRPMEVPACQAQRWSCTNGEEIHRALVEDPQASWAAIARRVHRSPTTVAREVARGGGRGRYRPATAQRRAERKRRRARCRRLGAPGSLRERITNELRLGRSPEAIRADLAADGNAGRPCTDTIYLALYSGALDVKPSQCLRSHLRRRRCAQRRNPRSRSRGPNTVQRPTAVDERAVAGQLGGRTDHRGQQPVLDGLLLTERHKPLPDPDHHARRLRRRRKVFAGLVEGLDAIPAHLRRSPTFDCGPEWANWRRLADHYDLQVWFCDPHSPWQRGQIENLNRQIRWWFPRGTDLRLVTVRPSRTRRAHHQPPTPPQPQPPKPRRTLCCPHRALTTRTGRPSVRCGSPRRASVRSTSPGSMTPSGPGRPSGSDDASPDPFSRRAIAPPAGSPTAR